MRKTGICLVTFSDNADHQNTVYSMYSELSGEVPVYTVGIVDPKSDQAVFSDNNFYTDCPKRPGITRLSCNCCACNPTCG